VSIRPRAVAWLLCETVGGNKVTLVDSYRAAPEVMAPRLLDLVSFHVEQPETHRQHAVHVADREDVRLR
jgi:hypothetical protein